MRVIKHIKSTGEKIKQEYPAIWPTPIYRLDSNLEFYEIQIMPYPENYNPNQHNAVEILTLTETQGELLKICLIEWDLQEKPQSEVLTNFNNSFGTFIDDAYPLWKRIKDFSQPTDEGTIRQAQEASLREERQAREDAYLNENIFPNFNFYWL